MKQNEADLVLHLTGVRDAGSRPVKLLLRRPAIDVMAECKAFPAKAEEKNTKKGSERVLQKASSETDRIVDVVQ